MADKKEGMSTKKKVGIGCLGIIVFFVLIGALASSGGDSTSSTNNGGSTTTQEAKKDYAAGETINLKNHQLTITSVNKNYSSGNPYDKPQSSDNSYVLVDVSIVNNGGGEIDVNPYGFKLEDESGTQRDNTWGGLADGKLESVTLSPGGKTSGKIVFEAKRGSSVLKLHYSPGLFGGGEVIINL